MKTIVIVVLFFITTVVVSAQTKDALALPIDWADTSAFVTKQTQFYLGWHWTGPRKTVNELLHTNHFHDHFGWQLTRDLKFPTIPDDGKTKALVWQHLAPGVVLEEIIALQFDPDAPVREQLPWYAPGKVALEPRAGDSTGALYGFAQRDTVHGHVPDTGANFNRYVLSKDSVPSGGAVVLNNPSLQTGFNYSLLNTAPITLRLAGGSTQTIPAVQYNGAQWYLSVNLRRNDITDTTMNGDTLLAMRVPYTRRDTTSNYIRFDSIAVTSLSADTLPFSRGITLNLRGVPGGGTDSLFVITRAMLPPGNAAEPDITVSAFFRIKTINTDTTTVNPHIQDFLTEWKDINNAHIIRMGLEVRYFGNSDIAIDRFRFETPYAQMVLRSYLDTAHFGHYINLDIDTVRAYHDRCFRLLSFYGLDDIGENPMYFMGQRHLSRLLSGRYTSYIYGDRTRRTVITPAHLWIAGVPGAQTSKWGIPPSMPYTFNGGAFGYKRGWGPGANAFSGVGFDSLTGSTYETMLYGDVRTLRDSAAFFTRYGYYPTGHRAIGYDHPMLGDTAKHKSWYAYPEYCWQNGDQGPLPSYESGLDDSYTRQQDLMFGGRPWWTNIWIGSNWGGERDGSGKLSIRNGVIRPQTGEETRLQMWGALIRGAKGLMFERMYHFPNVPLANTLVNGQTFGGSFLGAMNSIPASFTDSLLNALGERLFDSTMVLTGGDFIVSGDSSHIDQYLDTADVRANLGVRPDRFYIGRLSTRHEVKRVCDQIAGVGGIGDTLMKLRLAAWYAKGYEVVAAGDTALLSKFIALDTTKLRTRPIGRVYPHDVYETPQPYYDDSDSTFLDLTLLKDTTALPENVIYLGVQNRRTAPFVWLPDSDSLAINRPDTVRHSSHPGEVLTFLTTMEFENYVRRGKLARYSQSGAREVTLPFQYKDSLGRYALLRIKEMRFTADSVFGRPLDTVVGQDKKMVFNLLPGEGKIFRVEVLRSNEVIGDLRFNGQCKLAGHAIMRYNASDSVWQQTDSMLYVLTYHKPILDTGKLTGVYCRMSRAARRTDDNAALQWGSEHLLSSSIWHSGRWNTADTCAFPSVVVRFDSIAGQYRAYVVFSCASSYNPNPGGGMPDAQFIVQSVLCAPNDSTVSVIYAARALDEVAGRSLENWGTPVINAGDSLNLCFYSDKYRGIVAGWQYPDTLRTLVSTAATFFTDTTGSCTFAAQYPSTNSYSRYQRKERESNAAVVWQESNSCAMTSPEIIYSHVLVDSGVVRFGLPPRFIANLSAPAKFNADTSLVCLSAKNDTTFEGSHTHPVISRELYYPDCDFNGYMPGHIHTDLRYDDVYWEAHIPPPYPLLMMDWYGIMSRNVLAIDDTSGGNAIADTLYLGSRQTIWAVSSSGMTDFLDQPTVAAGETGNWPNMMFGSACFNLSRRAINLNFRRSETVAVLPGGNSDQSSIYHFPQGRLGSWDMVSIVDRSGLAQPHVAARGIIDDNWQSNRRVYNKASSLSLTPLIRSSGQYLFRGAGQEQAPEVISFTGWDADTSGYGVSSVSVDDKEYEFKPLRIPQPPMNLFAPPDTLVTEWFTVADEEQVSCYTTGALPESMDIWLERRSDGSRWRVEFSAAGEHRLLPQAVELTGGMGEEYRMTMSAASGVRYRRETVLTDEAEAVLARRNATVTMRINVAELDGTKRLTIFPNPAAEEVHIAVRGEGRAAVTIVNALGQIMWQTEATSGGVLTVRTAEFAAGLYAVRVQRAGLPETAGRFAVAR